MADAKISALPAATTPLAGTEVLPIVQSGVTKKVSSDDLTVKNVRSNATTGILQIAGPATGTTRVMTAPNANFTAARTDAAQTFTGAQTFSTPVATGSGGTGLSSFTANGLVYASSSSALTTGSAVTYDGAKLYSSGNLGLGTDSGANYVYKPTATNLATGQLNIQAGAGSASYGANVVLYSHSHATFPGTVYLGKSAGAAGPALVVGQGLGAGTNTEYMRVFSTGGVSIGDTTDPSAGNLRLGTGNLVIGTSGKGLDFGASVLWRTGAGSPEGVVTAAVGSLYTRTDGGLLTTLYVKESGAGNTGWVGK